MTSREDIRETIRSHGLRLGFDKVGFAPVRLKDESPRLQSWLADGLNGEMTWLEPNAARRTDARASLPGALTVVCCALNYYQGAPIDTPGRGIISSYAQGEDYHRVLEEKLDRYLDVIFDETGVRGKAYVDTGPILEKAYAVAAGLGWLGKHSNLISQRGSSWFFLGEILLPLALGADAAEPDRCGSCTRCMTACPTGAIVSPYVVDSRLCISYLTIELRGPIPRALRPLVGRRIYGCDDCQDVCPWNRFARKSEEERFLAREPLASMELADLLRLSRDRFLEFTRGSAIRRARYSGFLRNVAVALGNSGDASAVPVLVEALDHEEPLVRGHAAWALSMIRDFRARAPLERRRERESDPVVLAEIDAALERFDDAEGDRRAPSQSIG